MTELAAALFFFTALWARDLYRLREVLLRQERELDAAIDSFEKRSRRGIYR